MAKSFGIIKRDFEPNECKIIALIVHSRRVLQLRLTRRAQTDVHLALTEDPEDAETDSITAEITPRVRKHQHHDPQWQFRNVNDIEGEFVRITGLLMLDTKHIPQAHRLPGERVNRGLARATNWEVHPIFKLEVCAASLKKCKANKPAAFENF